MSRIFFFITFISLYLPKTACTEAPINKKVQEVLSAFPSSPSLSTPPFIIHIGHSLSQGNITPLAQSQTMQSFSFPALPLEKIILSLKETIQTHPYAMAGVFYITLVSIAYHHLFSLREKFKKKGTWISLLEDPFLPLEEPEILNPFFIEREAHDKFLGYSEWGALKRLYIETTTEYEALKKFQIFLSYTKHIAFTGLHPDFRSIEKKGNSYEEFLKKTLRAIASLLGSRYPNTQLF